MNVNVKSDSAHRFRIALSFPGEYRDFVKTVATHLAAALGSERILYDEYYEAEFARPNLDTYLQALYHDESELIVMFLCAEYEDKEWCGLEWRAIRDLIKKRNSASVMPCRFDDTEIPGLFSTDGYVWIGDRQPQEIAQVILQRLSLNQSTDVFPTAESKSDNKTQIKLAKIQVAKLPHTNSRLFGREDEIAMLDEAWKGSTNIVILEAMGGTGKTALLKTWMDQLAVDQYREANAVYTWSFYSQGSAEDKQGSADEFFDAALGWFGYQGDPISSAYEKGIKLAELINAQRTLLILDGLEPLQYPVGTMHGELKDQGLKALVQQLAASNQGLCLISSRQDVVEVKGKPLVIAHDLGQLQTSDGVELLNAMGVDGSDSELKKAVNEVVGHALALNLLGNYVKIVFKGDIRQRDKIPALSEAGQDGDHAQKVMAAYETHLAGSTALSILYLMGLIDRFHKGPSSICAMPKLSI